MDLNDIYENIIELDGKCFESEPNCKACPFIDKCLSRILESGESISAEQRVGWALSELMEGIVFDEE